MESFATFKEPRDNGIFTIIKIPIVSSLARPASLPKRPKALPSPHRLASAGDEDSQWWSIFHPAQLSISGTTFMSEAATRSEVELFETQCLPTLPRTPSTGLNSVSPGPACPEAWVVGESIAYGTWVRGRRVAPQGLPNPSLNTT